MTTKRLFFGIALFALFSCEDDRSSQLPDFGVGGFFGDETSAATGSSVSSTTTGSGGGYVAPVCNPITNAGCVGEVCDADFLQESFVCFPNPPPHDLALCERCGGTNDWCAVASTCHQGRCAKYCCDDGDCSTSGYCDKSSLESFPGRVGICLTPETAEGGMAGAAGAGGGGGAGGGEAFPHDCLAPLESPSMGSCGPS